jgi:hypothetical protein
VKTIITKLSGIVLLALPLTCMAQYRLKGMVLDAQTREALPGVNVDLPGIATATDAEGHFEVASTRPEQTATITFIGYVAQTVQLKASEDAVIGLQQDPRVSSDPATRRVMASLDVGYFGDARHAPLGFMVSMPIQSVLRVPLNLYPNFKYWKSGSGYGMDAALSKDVHVPVVDNFFAGYRSIDYPEAGFTWKQARGMAGKALPLGFGVDAGVTYSKLAVFQELERSGEDRYLSGLVGVSKTFRFTGGGDWGLYANLSYNANHTFYEAGSFKAFRIGKLPAMTVLAKYYNYKSITGLMV